MLRSRRFAPLAPSILILAVAACGKGPAYGSDNAIIAVLDPALSEALEPVFRRSFERTFFTTRPEPVFEVTFSPTGSIGEFRKWKRIVVVEPADERAVLVSDLLGRGLLETARTQGLVARVDDEWARGQAIWIVSAATPQATVDLARAKVDSLFDVIHREYVAGQVERMWASEPDSVLAERMLREQGFSILIPRVYTAAPASAPPNTLTFYNQEPRRIVSIHWTPRPATISADTVLAVRREWGRAIFPGDTIPARVPAGADTSAGGASHLFVGETTLGGLRAIRLQGVWENPSDLTGGVFLTYGVPCGDRLVLLDGNVYAPERPKYPYVIQLEQIFETFRCAGER